MNRTLVKTALLLICVGWFTFTLPVGVSEAACGGKDLADAPQQLRDACDKAQKVGYWVSGIVAGLGGITGTAALGLAGMSRTLGSAINQNEMHNGGNAQILNILKYTALTCGGAGILGGLASAVFL